MATFTVRFSVDGGAMTYRVHTDTEDNPIQRWVVQPVWSVRHTVLRRQGMNSNVLTQTIVTGSDRAGCRNSAPSARK